jgi:hypothetical protein
VRFEPHAVVGASNQCAGHAAAHESLAGTDRPFAPLQRFSPLVGYFCRVCQSLGTRKDDPGGLRPVTLGQSGYRYGRRFALKNATTALLNSLWKAARSNPAGSRQPSGAALANAGVHGAKNTKWPAFGTT